MVIISTNMATVRQVKRENQMMKAAALRHQTHTQQGVGEVSLPGAPSLHTHSSKFPIEREVIVRSGEKHCKIPILSEYMRRVKPSVAPDAPIKQLAWAHHHTKPVEKASASGGVGLGTSSTEMTTVPAHHIYKAVAVLETSQNSEPSPIRPLDNHQPIEAGPATSTPEENARGLPSRTYRSIKEMVSRGFGGGGAGKGGDSSLSPQTQLRQAGVYLQPQPPAASNYRPSSHQGTTVGPGDAYRGYPAGYTETPRRDLTKAHSNDNLLAHDNRYRQQEGPSGHHLPPTPSVYLSGPSRPYSTEGGGPSRPYSTEDGGPSRPYSTEGGPPRAHPPEGPSRPYSTDGGPSRPTTSSYMVPSGYAQSTPLTYQKPPSSSYYQDERHHPRTIYDSDRLHQQQQQQQLEEHHRAQLAAAAEHNRQRHDQQRRLEGHYNEPPRQQQVGETLYQESSNQRLTGVEKQEWRDERERHREDGGHLPGAKTGEGSIKPSSQEDDDEGGFVKRGAQSDSGRGSTVYSSVKAPAVILNREKEGGGGAAAGGSSRGAVAGAGEDWNDTNLEHILTEQNPGGGDVSSGGSLSSVSPPLPPLSPGAGSSGEDPTNLLGGFKSQVGGALWMNRTKDKPNRTHHKSNTKSSNNNLLSSRLEIDSMLDENNSSDEELDYADARLIRRQLEGLEGMYSQVLKLLRAKRYQESRYEDRTGMSRRRGGSVSSGPSSVSSRPLRRASIAHQARSKVRDFKGINKRFQRLESHVVTLARSVAHLSSEMRTQHLMMQEMEVMRGELASLRLAQTSQLAANTPARHPPPPLQTDRPAFGTTPDRLKRLTKFFGDEPPLLRLFLRRLGYEKYAGLFEKERIGLLELPYLTEERLQKLGIPLGPRLRILQQAHLASPNTLCVL